MFELSTQGAVHVIGGEGALCADSVDQLNALLEQCLLKCPPRVVVDLSLVPYLDSAGLEWLLDASDQCSNAGGLVHVAAANALCSDILQVTGVGAHLEAFADVLQAVGSFAR